jgi:hypothetical protein
MVKNIPASTRAAKLVKAKPNECWKNAANLMFESGFESASYVEGAIVTPTVSQPQEHGWVVLNGEIIDPTLPEKDIHYFPALEWPKDAFLRLYFEDSEMPFFRRVAFLTDSVQVEMNKARQRAKEDAPQSGGESRGTPCGRIPG